MSYESFIVKILFCNHDLLLCVIWIFHSWLVKILYSLQIFLKPYLHSLHLFSFHRNFNFWLWPVSMMQYPVLNQMKAWSYCMMMAEEGFSPVQLSGWSRPVNNSRPLERLPSVILLVPVSFNSIMIRIFSNIAHWEAIEVTMYRGSVLYQHWGTSISNIRAWKANISEWIKKSFEGIVWISSFFMIFCR